MFLLDMSPHRDVATDGQITVPRSRKLCRLLHRSDKSAHVRAGARGGFLDLVYTLDNLWMIELTRKTEVHTQVHRTNEGYIESLHHLVNRLFYFARFELTNHQGAGVGLAKIPRDRNSPIACPRVSNADRAGALRGKVHHRVKASCVCSASQAWHLNAHGPRFEQAVDQALCWLGKPDRHRQPSRRAAFNAP